MNCLLTLALCIALSGAGIAMPDHYSLGKRPKKEIPTPTKPIMNVVLVHGLFETGRSFGMMRDALQSQNVHCLIARLKPRDAREGIDQLAVELQRQIDAEFGKDARISIVAFSMGGLVSRYYLQELNGTKRCDRLITISTPHHGSVLAHGLYGKGGWQMRPGSPFLKQLEASESKLGKMPVSSLRSPLDLVVVPSTRSIWNRAENRSYIVLLHPMMLTDHRIIADVKRQLLGS